MVRAQAGDVRDTKANHPAQVMRFLIVLMLAFLLYSCGSKSQSMPELHALWFASGESIGYLNIERMALDLRADSTYRYFYKLAPVPPNDSGFESTEAGRYFVSNDSLNFTVLEKNGSQTTYEYSRRFKLLSDTTEWPLRVSFARQGVEFDVYFQAQK